MARYAAVAADHRIAIRLARRLVNAPGSMAARKMAAALVALDDALGPLP